MAEVTELGRKARAAYMRDWRRRNPDKQRRIMIEYWERRGERMEKDQSDKRDEKGNDASR